LFLTSFSSIFRPQPPSPRPVFPSLESRLFFVVCAASCVILSTRLDFDKGCTIYIPTRFAASLSQKSRISLRSSLPIHHSSGPGLCVITSECPAALGCHHRASPVLPKTALSGRQSLFTH
ncbi:hypothetical protein FA10DRAFT_254052, partial [Acaromyces ingoldii]